MKEGKTLTALAAEIERQSQAKQDYVADTRKLELVPSVAEVIGTSEDSRPDVRLALINGSRTELPIRALAHRQIGERVGVPAKYYDRMLKDAPALLARNVNHWLKEEPEKRLIRTLDGNVRAFLSNKYQRIDNVHVAETVLPILANTQGIQIASCEITESRLYIKATTKMVAREVRYTKRVGDVVEAGVMISNSEVGLGAISVTPFYFFLACKNGMVRQKEGMRSAHIGTRLDAADGIAELLADDTRKVLDRGVLLKVRDVLTAAMSQAKLDETIDALEAATRGEKIEKNPAASIELLGNELNLGEGERSSVLRHLIEGGDLSRYGVLNAVTRTAEDALDYDRATELETAGGRILDMAPGTWKRIALAA